MFTLPCSVASDRSYKLRLLVTQVLWTSLYRHLRFHLTKIFLRKHILRSVSTVSYRAHLSVLSGKIKLYAKISISVQFCDSDCIRKTDIWNYKNRVKFRPRRRLSFWMMFFVNVESHRSVFANTQDCENVRLIECRIGSETSDAVEDAGKPGSGSVSSPRIAVGEQSSPADITTPPRMRSPVAASREEATRFLLRKLVKKFCQSWNACCMHLCSLET